MKLLSTQVLASLVAALATLSLGDFPSTQALTIASAVHSLNPQLASILPTLKQNIKIPILLPSNFPSKGINFCPEYEQNKYSVILLEARASNCQMSEAVFLGYISGERGHQTLKVTDEDYQKVKLSKGVLGYYSPRSYKSAPRIEWIYKENHYTMQLKEYIDGKERNSSQAKAFIISAANSAIQAGAR
jgi:hypothetical protein